ncbi:MAG: NapC/NirT family cytochrome c [Parvularculaceae bacterium]
MNTKEKFEAKRLELAKNVWAEMKANDSENCRSCHHVDNWDLSLQKTRARGQHEEMAETGETCIDCHKGIAHKAVHEDLEEEDSFSLEDEDDPFSLEEEEESFELE